jgi:hypothetical protein
MLLVLLLVVAVAAGGYLERSKIPYLHSTAKVAPPTVTLPPSVLGAAKTTDPTAVAALAQVRTDLRKASPALAGMSVALYGPTASPKAVIAAGAVPATVNLKDASAQLQLVTLTNRVLSQGQSAPDKLAKVPFTAKPDGQLWCGTTPAADADPSVDCIYVDRWAVVIVSTLGADKAKSVAKTEELIAVIEH